MDWKRLTVLVVPALLGLSAVLYACQKYGIALFSDSVGYIRVAREILAGQGIPEWFNLQPPLYPIALALAGFLTRTDPLEAAVWLNAFVFAGVIFVAGMLFFRHLAPAPAFALVGTVGVLFARPLMNVAVAAYSEILFILLVLGALLAIELYLENRTWGWLGAAIGCTALACLTRYLGVALLAAGTISLLLDQWAGFQRNPQDVGDSDTCAHSGRARGLVTVVLYCLLAGLPLALWLMRNILVVGQAFGERAPSRFTFLQNLNLTRAVLADWFAPNAWQGILWLGVGLVFAVWLVLLTRRRFDLFGQTPTLAPVILFGAFFLLILVVSATTTAYNRINSRLLSPVFVPVLLLLFLMVDRVLASLRGRLETAATTTQNVPAHVRNMNYPKNMTRTLRGRVDARVVNAAGLAIVLLLLIFPLATALGRLEEAARDGAGGYNTTRWRTSKTLAFVASHPEDLRGTLYSNGGDVLYILGNLETESIPAKYLYASDVPANRADALRGTYPVESSTVIWLKNIDRDDFLFSLEELGQFTDMTLVSAFNDGAIYRMDKRER